jgi:hypothetical protein
MAEHDLHERVSLTPEDMLSVVERCFAIYEQLLKYKDGIEHKIDMNIAEDMPLYNMYRELQQSLHNDLVLGKLAFTLIILNQDAMRVRQPAILRNTVKMVCMNYKLNDDILFPASVEAAGKEA